MYESSYNDLKVTVGSCNYICTNLIYLYIYTTTIKSLQSCPTLCDPIDGRSLQSCPTLCDPIDGSPPGPTVPGILQARTLEWVAISSSNAWKRKVKVKLFSRVRFLATPWTAAYQAPPSMGFSRQEYWSGLPLGAFKLWDFMYLWNPTSIEFIGLYKYLGKPKKEWN